VTLVAKVYRHPDYDSPVATLADAMGRGWQDRLNDAGTGELTVQNDQPDRDLIAPDDVVVFELDAVPVFGWVVRDDESTTADPGGEASQATRFSGPGLVGLFGEAVVLPSRGPGAKPVETDRTFGWMAPSFDDSGWSSAVQRFAVNATDWPPAGLLGAPEGWPEQGSTAYWISSHASDPPEPVGSSFFRRTFSVGSETDVTIFAAGDDGFILWVDGSPVMSVNNPPSIDGWARTHSQTVTLSAGDHTIAAEVINFDRAANADNIQAFVCAVIEVDQTSGQLGSVVVVSTSAWKTLDYPDPRPGMTMGQILGLLFDEAQDEDLLDGWSWTFDGDDDSDGNPWPILSEVSTRTGSTYLDTLRQWAETGYLDFVARPGLTFDAYVGGGLGGASTVELVYPTDEGDPWSGNLGSLEHQRKAITATRLLVLWADGWLVVDDTPDGQRPKAAQVDIGYARSVEEATTAAQAMLDLYRGERAAVVAGWEPHGDGDLPYVDAVIGDTVIVPDRDGTPVSKRLVGLTVAEDDNGRIIFAPELGDVFLSPAERHEVALSRAVPGMMAGSSRVPSPVSERALPAPQSSVASGAGGEVYGFSMPGDLFPIDFDEIQFRGPRRVSWVTGRLVEASSSGAVSVNLKSGATTIAALSFAQGSDTATVTSLSETAVTFLGGEIAAQGVGAVGMYVAFGAQG
jgi:hypothetical protein